MIKESKNLACQKTNEPPHDKTNKMTVRPVKTQISLGIRPVWSESSLCPQWVAKDPSFLHADSKDWSDWADAQADLSLRWEHMPFCWFYHEAAQMSMHLPVTILVQAQLYVVEPTENFVQESFKHTCLLYSI